MYRLACIGDVVAFKVGHRQRSGVAHLDAFSQRVARRDALRAIRGSTSDDRIGCSASDGRCAPARPALHGVACSTRLSPFLHMRARECRWYSARFHYCAFCERAAPDAPETIDDQRRCTGCRYRTIYGGSRGSASLPRRRSGSVPQTRIRAAHPAKIRSSAAIRASDLVH